MTSFVEMQIVYFIDNFEDNHNIVLNSFVTDSVMKNGTLAAKKHKEFSICISLAQSH